MPKLQEKLLVHHMEHSSVTQKALDKMSALLSLLSLPNTTAQLGTVCCLQSIPPWDLLSLAYPTLRILAQIKWQCGKHFGMPS